MGLVAHFLVLLGTFIYLLGRTLEVLPVGTAYAVWTGIGAVGTTILGILLFQESVNAVRLASIAPRSRRHRWTEAVVRIKNG